MRKTYTELQTELLNKTKGLENLKIRVKTLREEVLKSKTMEKKLIISYEKVVKEWQDRYNNLINNGWKILAAKMVNKYQKFRGA